MSLLPGLEVSLLPGWLDRRVRLLNPQVTDLVPYTVPNALSFQPTTSRHIDTDVQLQMREQAVESRNLLVISLQPDGVAGGLLRTDCAGV